MDGRRSSRPVQYVPAKRNVLERLGSYLPSDEHEALQQYVSEAEQGQYFVTVYAPHPDQIERARDILAKHGASDMHYYGERALGNY